MGTNVLISSFIFSFEKSSYDWFSVPSCLHTVLHMLIRIYVGYSGNIFLWGMLLFLTTWFNFLFCPRVLYVKQHTFCPCRFPLRANKDALLSYFIYFYFITAAFQYILHIFPVLNIFKGTAFKLTDTSRTSLLCNCTFVSGVPSFGSTSRQLLISHLVNLKSSFSLHLQCGLL